MLRQKFRYADYEKLWEQREYARAQEYCASFPNNKNAVICGFYSQYRLLQSSASTDTSFHELDAAIKGIYQNIYSRGHRGYDKNALYLLGILLFERGFETKGDDVLASVLSLEKKREKLSETEKSARSYLELRYFQKWENGHQMEDLKQAADCFGHSEICYLYAEKLREKGCGREADQYEFIYAADYCAVWMDKDTYHRKHMEYHRGQAENDIRKDIGLIASDMAMVKESLGGMESHLEIMLQKINNLPETMCDALQKEFNAFRTQMSELSEQISTADQDREKRLAQVLDGLKNVVFENKDPLLREIVNEARAEIDGRFQGRLSEEARKSIVTSLFTLNFYKKLNRTQKPLIEYSGVVILATKALEIELCNRLYALFIDYLQEKHGQKLDDRFTLGSFGYVVGIWRGRKDKQEQEKRYNRFSEFIQERSDQFSTNLGSLFQYGSDAKLQCAPLEHFAARLKRLNVIRRNAAHINLVTLEDAEEACQLAFLSPQERADKVTDESISLLEWLLNSCNEAS